MKLRITAYLLFPGISEIYSGEPAWHRVKVSGGKIKAVIARSTVPAGYSAKCITHLEYSLKDFLLVISRAQLKLTNPPNEQPKR